VSEGAAKKEEKPQKFQAIRGTRDLLPPETALWNRVEQIAHEVFASYGFGEIRLPIFEATELFARSIGLDTDIVGKEMFSFEDYENSSVLEYRNAVITWREPREVQGQPSAAGVGAFAKYQSFTDMLWMFCLSGREAFNKGLLPRTPENDSLLNELVGERDIFITSTQSRSDRENRADVDRLKERVRQIRLGDEITLRPEATASVCRAYIENGMQQLPQPVKLYTIGPMFRRERPQKGRYRQFYQIDAEVLEKEVASGEWRVASKKDAATDAELIEMVMTLFERLGLEGVQLDINSIGDKKCRPKYVELLRRELSKVKDKLGPDSQRRIETNPLRVLDSKLESEQKIIEGMPHIADHLCEECAENYRGVKKELELRGVKYHENWRLVRGLDYYSRTTFEITAKGLGSQNAVCGGGRYDGLMELLGGPPTRATGFAIGEDRLILSLQEQAKRRSGEWRVASGEKEKDREMASEWRVASGKPHVYIAWMGENAYAAAIRAAKNLRAAGLSVELPPAEQKFAKALGQADKLGARYALILGDNEVASGEWTLKTLASGEQLKFTEQRLLDFLKKKTAARSSQSTA
jgi:histidyl-tRNA synthetase